MLSLLVRIIQPVYDPFLSDSSPVPVDLGPRQTQTDPSVRSPCIDYGSVGEAQEPVQVSWPPLPFLSLRTARFFSTGRSVRM